MIAYGGITGGGRGYNDSTAAGAVAAFMIARGEHWFFGINVQKGSACNPLHYPVTGRCHSDGCGKPCNASSNRMAPATAALVTSDYGRPVAGAAGRAHAVVGRANVFARQFEKAVVTLDCSTWSASFDLKTEDEEALSLADEIRAAVLPVMRAGSERTNNSGYQLGLYSASWNLSLAVGLNERAPGKQTALRGDDMFVWGSITKFYTAVSVLRQVEAGRITLDEPICPYIDPWLKRTNGTSLTARFGKEMELVSARNLLQMASGMQDFEVEPHLRLLQNALPKVDLDNPLNALAWTNKTFFFPPNAAAVYVSNNFEVAGLLLAALDNASSWDTYDQRKGAMSAQLSALLTRTAFPVHGPCSNFVGGTHDGKNGSAAHGYQRAYNCSTVCDSYSASCAKGTACCEADVKLCETSYPGAWSDVSNMSCTSGWACGNLAASTLEIATYVGKH